MPSINAVIAAGRDVQTCRRLIDELSQVAVDVLDSVPLLSRGRSPEVLLALLTRFTGVTQDVLGVERRHVHVVLRELPREHIGEMGVPMAARATRGGSPAGSPYRRARRSWTPEPHTVTRHPSPVSPSLTACLSLWRVCSLTGTSA
ncbi:tautomerase family protein [Streptomyces sp. NPDC002920]